ncbi:MAG: gamma-glutamyltransferase family protein [Pseudomonadota bacterium]
MVIAAACADPDIPPQQSADDRIEASDPKEHVVETLPWIVAAAHPYAAEAGAQILRKGGTAADAAVAVQATLGLVEPQSSGLGGGAFMLYYDAQSGILTAYDGREFAPASVKPDVFLREDGTPMGFIDAVTSGLSVGVPGTVALLEKTHKEHGQLAWPELFETPIILSRDGFSMPQRLHYYAGRLAALREEAGAAIYFGKDGAPVPVGGTVMNAAYADTLSLIAEEGSKAFYHGPLADAVIARVNRQTGEDTLTREDFADYEVEVRNPVCTDIQAFEVCSMPPPSSGGITLLQIAGIFEATGAHGSPEDHLLSYVEATRLAYADRGRYIGDPAEMGTETLSADQLTRALVSPQYLAGRAALISDGPLEKVEPGSPAGPLIKEGRADGDPYERPSTSHFSIRDRYGNIVSMTTTVEFAFGSQMMAAGMVLNNQLTDFSRVPEVDGRLVVNAPRPRKRPLSSMTPVMVFDDSGAPYAAMGSPGGPAIIGYVARPLLAHLLGGETFSEAMVRPHIVVPRGRVIVETGGDSVAEDLRLKGYDVMVRDLSSGIYGFVLGKDGIDLLVDPRREGVALIGRDEK